MSGLRICFPNVHQQNPALMELGEFRRAAACRGLSDLHESFRGQSLCFHHQLEPLPALPDLLSAGFASEEGKGDGCAHPELPDSTFVLTQAFSFLPTLPPAELLLSGRDGESEVKQLKNSRFFFSLSPFQRVSSKLEMWIFTA